MDKRVYWIWLQQAVGYAWPQTGRLLRDLGDAEQIYAAGEAELNAAGLSGAILRNLKNKSLGKAEKILSAAVTNGWAVLTPEDPLFPDAWAALPDLPLVIYVQGSFPTDLRDRLSLSLIATRKISPEGLELTGRMAAGLAAAGVTVIGDTIAGGDEAVMAAVASVGGHGIILQPCGLDVSYPKRSESVRDGVLSAGGAMLSEFPAGTPVRPENFAYRNRLLATLSQAIVVTEAGETSGTLRVAGLAAAAGHEVLAVPGDRACHAGCHRLIREGALLVQSAAEIVREFSGRYPLLSVEEADAAEAAYHRILPEKPVKPEKKPRKRTKSVRFPEPVKPFSVVHRRAEPQPLPADLSENARRIAEQLTDEPQGIDRLTEQTGLAYPQAFMALTELELKGVAVGHPGGRYSRK